MLIVFTGNGKGKTSAALGTALRASGWEKRVAIIQFIKGNKEVGEWKLLQKISNIEIHQFFDNYKLDITEKEITDIKSKEYKDSCQKAWEFAKETILNGKHDLIVLDEINNALNYGLLDKKEILEFIRDYSDENSDSDSDIILTGRNAPAEMIEIANLVTEMKEIKHPFQKGISAKEGIDY